MLIMKSNSLWTFALMCILSFSIAEYTLSSDVVDSSSSCNIETVVEKNSAGETNDANDYLLSYSYIDSQMHKLVLSRNASQQFDFKLKAEIYKPPIYA